MKKSKNKIENIYRFLVYCLPVVLFFSYYPLIHFGSNGTMNWEISLPIIWLVVFDLTSLFLLIKNKKMNNIWRKWPWFFLPAFLTLSLLWSLNSLRGLFTIGILWFLYFAGFSFFELKSCFNDDVFKKRFWQVLFGFSLVICGWCFLQCVLDLVGVSRDYSLMCAGCTYQMFGFPHPNGFAIEPQFMGNLLLLPTIVAAGLFLKNQSQYKNTWFLQPKGLLVCFFVFAVTLFLTFSRGAIYAFLLAMLFLTIVLIVREKTERRKLIKKSNIVWIMVIIAFLFTLNLQGMMAEVSKTNDTYKTGITKVLNHLTLGFVDMREKTDGNIPDDILKKSNNNEIDSPAIFDGYVEESTNTRLRLSDAAIKAWSQDFKTIMFGVGLGGAGQALYNQGLSISPKEIIQNEYVSLLLEIGFIGIIFLVITLYLVFKVVLINPMRFVILSLIIAYMISLMFFSGLPNALQVYLMPSLLMALNDRMKK